MKARKKFLILTFFILSISLYACGKGKPSLAPEDLKTAASEKETAKEKQTELTAQEKVKNMDSATSEEADSINQPEADLPEFIENYFEFGRYTEKILLPNTDNTEYAAINKNNQIEIPECSVLSFLFVTLYNDLVLYDGSPEKIRDFFREIQKLEFQKEPEYVDTLPLNADCVFESDSIMINAHGSYIRMNIRSFNDGTHYFDIHQEHQEVIYASAKSESLLNLVMTMAGLEHVDLSKLEQIEKLEASVDNSWTLLEEEQKEIFQLIIKDNVKKIKNYSGGCPFDYRLRATLHDGEVIDLYYSSDSCGTLVIGDSTYEVELAPEEGETFKYREQLEDFFTAPSL